MENNYIEWAVFVLFESTLLAFPLKWSWNHIIPFLFGLPKITALQAFCLIWVMGIFFKWTRNIEREKEGN